MSLILRSPEFDDFFDGRFPSIFSQKDLKSFIPALDVFETEKDLVVKTPLAGVDSKDVDVSVKNGVLTIKGATKKEHEVDEKNYYRKEVRSGSFHRELTLPVEVDENKVSAEFDNGMLKVICPKAKQAETKKIEVKVVK